MNPMKKISISAKAVAYLRFLEENVSKDTLAKYFYDEDGKKLALDWIKWYKGVSRTVAIRGRYIEDTVERYIKNNQIKQMVNIASGFNTFPYRHNAANRLLRYAELDLPLMIRFKKKKIEDLRKKLVIKNSLKVFYVPIDVSSANFSNKFKTIKWNWKEPSIYVIEGLSYYLSFNILENLITTISSIACKGSVLIMDYSPISIINNKIITKIISSSVKIGGEKGSTFLTCNDIDKLMKGFKIISDRGQHELEKKYYNDSITIKIGSIIVAEKE